jgi:hypothetical protein
MAHIVLLCVLAALLLVGPCQARPLRQPTATSKQGTVDGITAIYNLGDSISDTGNFVREGAVGMMQHTGELPYGSAIDGATGRCSDGYLMIDNLAKDLGLPLLSPYLDKGADFTHGVNFAASTSPSLAPPPSTRRPWQGEGSPPPTPTAPSASSSNGSRTSWLPPPVHPRRSARSWPVRW